MTRSITVRLTALFAGAAVIVFTVIATGLYFVIQSKLNENLQAVLKTRSDIAQSIVQHVSSVDKWAVVRDRLSDISMPENSTLIYLQSPDPRFSYGKPIVGSLQNRKNSPYRQLMLPGRPYPMLATTIAIAGAGERPDLELTVASDSAGNAQVLHALLWAMLFLFASASLVVIVLGLRLAKIGLLPLHRFSEQAAQLHAGNLGQRLTTDRLASELLPLASAFNAALGRLDQAFDRLASFNADVAHELRTPIGIVIGETEVALARSRSVDELRSTMMSNLEEFARLKNIVNDMLFLARVDRGEYAKNLVGTSLRRECESLIDFFETLFEDAAISAVVKGDAQVEIDVSLFQRALSNLLQNAIQHAAPGSEVVVGIEESDSATVLTVANYGVDIPTVKLPHVFDRFYRVEEHRENSDRNHGLGLAIVKAVADIHGGTVGARSALGINTFALTLPKVKNPAITASAHLAVSNTAMLASS